jgi:hypothetical protein
VGRFEVKGDVTWYSGVYKAWIDEDSEGHVLSCYWRATKSFTVGANAKISFTEFGGLSKNSVWTVLEADEGIAGVPAIDQPYEGQFTLFGNLPPPTTKLIAKKL